MMRAHIGAKAMPEAVIVSLVKRRADLAGELNTVQARLNQLHADLASLDDVIKQFDPEYRLDSIRPRYRRQASTAETASISRAVLDTLRRAGEALSAKAIGALVMAERGLNMEDRALVRSMTKRVDMALRYQRTNGIVEATEVEGGSVVWSLGR
jgi:predicted nuclease with TOPRIM domain